MGIAFAFAAGCGDSDPGAPDAGADAPDAAFVPVDAAPPADRIDPLLWVEFSAAGCDSGGFDGQPCVGTAPLDLRFTVTAPAPVDTYVWSFGDGTPSEDVASPLHRFDLPGTYDVGLVVGGPGGTASSSHPGFVIVQPAEVGAACDVSAHCAAGLTCTCDGADDCPPGLAAGLCTAACSDAAPCDEPAVCADLAASEPDAPDVWQAALCLAGCDDDDDCRDGFACRDLPASDGGTWVRGCFPASVLADEGGSCRAVDGAPNDDACAGGACADEGARGLCAAACTPGVDGTCPSYATCATFSDGARCLARCGDGVACDADPWLGCEAPNADGDKGFTVDEDPNEAGYCGPKRCESPTECGPDGTCSDGFCAAA